VADTLTFPATLAWNQIVESPRSNSPATFEEPVLRRRKKTGEEEAGVVDAVLAAD